ncbi:hypothetical protein, partial [Thiobacillus sp.]|uniref:hypothetical protein n=1 Tax=Thiobacillus sp. TaxID=924 RepID=UPI002600CBBD
EEIAGWADALGLRQATGRQIGYINPRTLKPSATEKRGDVAGWLNAVPLKAQGIRCISKLGPATLKIDRMVQLGQLPIVLAGAGIALLIARNHSTYLWHEQK